MECCPDSGHRDSFLAAEVPWPLLAEHTEQPVSGLQQLPKQHNGNCVGKASPGSCPWQNWLYPHHSRYCFLKCWPKLQCIPGRERAPYTEDMVLLVAAVLLLGLAVKSEALCSPTTFYKDCWIRRFPGLLIDLQESQKRGAQVLKIYAEVSPQQCSRTCCLLSNASCNLAVFYHGTIHESMNCLHVSCPALESCILKARINVVLYNITTGTDPDLLLFGKLASPEASPHLSPTEHQRENNTKATKQERCQHHTTTSSSPLIQAPFSTSSYSLPANTHGSSTGLRSTTPAVPSHSSAETLPTDDHFAKRLSIASESSSSDKTLHSTLTPRSPKVLSPMPTPPGLNSSKQHSNETKGYSGRNYTSDNQASPWEPAALGLWLIPVVLCCSLIFLCCCTVAFTAGHCSRRKGQYKPIPRKRTTSRQFMKHSTGKGSW